MLSSVANRCYWAARYLERAENTARLVDVYTALMLDLPDDAGIEWQQLMRICGCEKEFAAYRRWPEERSAVKFMTAELDNPVSILTSINRARENLRTLRDLVPKEGFEEVNEFYHSANTRLKRITSRRGRHKLLDGVVGNCQRLTGLFSGTMSHGPAYQFMRMGRNLERADMTSRILDVAAEQLARQGNDPENFSTMVWVNVLRSASAYQAYRQEVRTRVTPAAVIYFLLASENFPRSVAHTLDQVEVSALRLPKHESVVATISSAKQAMSGMSLRQLVRESLHEELDRMQSLFIDIDREIANAWFEH